MGTNPEDAAAHCQLASLSLQAHLVAQGNNHGVKLSGANSWEMTVSLVAQSSLGELRVFLF